MAQVAGNLQRIRNGQRRYAITPRIPAGFIQPQTLQKFIDVANTFHATLKITGAQRIMITNLKAEDVDKAWEMLGMQPAHSVSNRVRSVKICPGTTFCKRAKQDSVHLGMQLEQKYISKEMPSKMKFGISGCPNSCAESITKDIGIIGTEQGWQVYAGGSAGAHPRFADLIAEVTTEQKYLTSLTAWSHTIKKTHISNAWVPSSIASVLPPSKKPSSAMTMFRLPKIPQRLRQNR